MHAGDGSRVPQDSRPLAELVRTETAGDWGTLARVGAALSEQQMPPDEEPQGQGRTSGGRADTGAPRFVFRGARDGGQVLRATLERCAERVQWQGPRQALEDGLLHEFQRRAHHYVADLPPRDATLEWLALMRHHGAPTRLLDWTYSFWVALFFALEESRAAGTGTAAVWALDRWQIHCCHLALLSPEELTLRRQDTHTSDARNFARFYRQERHLIFFENPFRLNERLALQQGLFALHANVEGTFEDDLLNMYEEARARRPALLPSPPEAPLLYRVEIPHALVGSAIRELHRMNISRATLFPGLDGFAQSLGNTAFERHRLQEDP
jgi:hypothetical protein